MALKDKYYTISEAAESLNVTRQTISRWIKEGKFPTEKVGRETLLEKRQVWQHQDMARANTILSTIHSIIFDAAFKEYVGNDKNFSSFAIESMHSGWGPFKVSATVESPFFEFRIKRTDGIQINISARVDEVIVSRDKGTESISVKIKEIKRVETTIPERPPDGKKGTQGQRKTMEVSQKR